MFIERVMRVRVSSRFKLPSHLRVYEKKTDPMDHLDSYKNLMMLQGYLDEVMYKALSETLKGQRNHGSKSCLLEPLICLVT